MCEGDELLQHISGELRQILPENGLLPSEQISFPTVGENADCRPEHTRHVDAFLYDDAMLEELYEEGKIERYYCATCGSHDVKPMQCISHSCSRDRIAFIFRGLLPPVDGKVVLDVGSRLGAVLYGAYVYTGASKIIGVEMNEDFCRLQTEIVQRHKFQNRIVVVQGNICSHPQLINAADVIVMNNVFEFFLPLEDEKRIWEFIRANTRPGTLLVTAPPLLKTPAVLQSNIGLSAWVEELQPYNLELQESYDWTEEIESVNLYRIRQ